MILNSNVFYYSGRSAKEVLKISKDKNEKSSVFKVPRKDEEELILKIKNLSVK